jgi:hypothetical protein
MLKDSTILIFIVSSAVGFYRKPYSTLQNTRVFCQIFDHEFHVIELGRKLDKNSSRIRIRITLMRLKHWLQYSRIWKKPIPGVKTALDPGSGSALLIYFTLLCPEVFYVKKMVNNVIYWINLHKAEKHMRVFGGYFLGF